MYINVKNYEIICMRTHAMHVETFAWPDPNAAGNSVTLSDITGVVLDSVRFQSRLIRVTDGFMGLNFGNFV